MEKRESRGFLFTVLGVLVVASMFSFFQTSYDNSNAMQFQKYLDGSSPTGMVVGLQTVQSTRTQPKKQPFSNEWSIVTQYKSSNNLDKYGNFVNELMNSYKKETTSSQGIFSGAYDNGLAKNKRFVAALMSQN